MRGCYTPFVLLFRYIGREEEQNERNTGSNKFHFFAVSVLVFPEAQVCLN
jgi:hypothetical protein